MTQDQNFEPYMDFAAVSDEMAKDLRSYIVNFERAKMRLIRKSSSQNAAEVLRTQIDVTACVNAIHEEIFRQPVMVHVAGPKSEETQEGTDAVIQRCSKCGSVLQLWHEGLGILTPEGPKILEIDGVPWWNEGDIVAKANSPGSIDMYEVEKGRKLEKHEHPCPDFVGQFSES